MYERLDPWIVTGRRQVPKRPSRLGPDLQNWDDHNSGVQYIVKVSRSLTGSGVYKALWLMTRRSQTIKPSYRRPHASITNIHHYWR